MPRSRFGQFLERGSRLVTNWTGSSWAFAVAVVVVLVWLLTGPLFHYSDTWQLVINTGTTIVTFLMVFLIQRAQNKDALAVHLKLNEIVAALQGASNRLIDIEDLNEAELTKLHKFYKRLADMSKHDDDLGKSHSYDEATALHRRKQSQTELQPPPPAAPPTPEPPAQEPPK
jgi:low affinity Fe/Cu permease